MSIIFNDNHDWKDIERRHLHWQLGECVKVLKWYAASLRPEDRLNDNGEKAADVLEDINQNKN